MFQYQQLLPPVNSQGSSAWSSRGTNLQPVSSTTGSLLLGDPFEIDKSEFWIRYTVFDCCSGASGRQLMFYTYISSAGSLNISWLFLVYKQCLSVINMDLNTKNMFYTKKNMFKPCFKPKNVFVYFVYWAQKNVALPGDMYIFSGFKHVYSCLLFSRGGQL
jgi:hypothetical protein